MKKNTPLLVLLALGQLTCNQAIMTAPANSNLTMFINPTIISANGGVAVVSVIVVEPAGTGVPDGTVVQFFTNLGDIPEQGKTNDGVVRVNFRANGRSGTAAITAVSGGAAAPPASPSPTPTPTPTPLGLSSSEMPFFAAGVGTAEGSVTIGNLGANSILVTADPPRITVSRSTQITATVFDTAGNPLPGVPVFFDIDPDPMTGGGASTNFMDSAGQPRFTDSDGRAFDVMRTRNVVSGTAVVRARVPTAAAAFLSARVAVPIVI